MNHQEYAVDKDDIDAVAWDYDDKNGNDHQQEHYNGGGHVEADEIGITSLPCIFVNRE